MANKILYGLKDVHVAFRAADDSAGEAVWDTPIAIPGAIGFRPSPEGEEFKQYADNGVYFTDKANTGYSADLEMALIPDSVIAAMFNWPIDANGAIIEDTDALAAPFALMGQIEGDSKGRRFVYYECRASRPSPEERTKEASIAARTDVLPLIITPVEIDGASITRAYMEESETNTVEYAAFFDDVYIPVETSA